MEFKKLPNGTANFQPHPAIHEFWREQRPDLQLFRSRGSGCCIGIDRMS